MGITPSAIQVYYSILTRKKEHSRVYVKAPHSEKNLSEEYVNFVTLESLPNAIGLDEVREASLNDQTIQTAILYTRTGRWYQMKDLLPESGVNLEELTAIRSVSDELAVHSDNVLLRNNRIVLPQTLRKRAVQASHEGHQGMAKTKAYLRSKVWFPGMDALVENSVKNCASCKLLAPEPRAMELLKMSELPGSAWENLSMDFCGPLPSGEYLFVIIDEYTRYPVVEVVRSVAAKTAIPVLDKVISAYCIPRVIMRTTEVHFNLLNSENTWDTWE